MKSVIYALLASAVMGTFAVAGGNEAVAKPAVAEIPQAENTTSAFYAGLGYGYFKQKNDDITYNSQDLWSIEIETDNILFQAGYQYNQYVAVEARYWMGIGDATITGLDGTSSDESGDYASWGIYLKPMYPVTERFNIYAMLGYASTSLESDSGAYWDTDGFSWGAGAEFGVTEHVFIFADYVNLMTPDSFDLHAPKYGVIPDIDMDGDLYTFNLGVTYKF